MSLNVKVQKSCAGNVNTMSWLYILNLRKDQTVILLLLPRSWSPPSSERLSIVKCQSRIGRNTIAHARHPVSMRNTRLQAPPTPAQTAPMAHSSSFRYEYQVYRHAHLCMHSSKKDRREEDSDTASKRISTAIKRNPSKSYKHGTLRVSIQLHGTSLYLGLSLDTSRNNVPVRALLLQLAGNRAGIWSFRLAVLLQTLSQRIQ